jgi:hypothetical protein
MKIATKNPAAKWSGAFHSFHFLFIVKGKAASGSSFR